MEHDAEPVPGLPGALPPGEHILWQGAPVRRVLARTVFHVRLVALYFAGLALIAALAGGGVFGIGATLVCGIAAVGLLELLAWATAKTTLYTLTNRRIVLRIGIALPTCINLPLSRITAIDLGAAGGDVALTPTDLPGLGYAALWPHARPWALARPQPMLRALPDAPAVAELIARTARAAGAPRPAAAVPAADPIAVAA